MITETQLLANIINDWFNEFGSQEYDIFPDFNPLETEKFDSSLDRFNQTADDMIKQSIESDIVKAVVKTGINAYDPVQRTYAVTTAFTVDFWLDVKKNATSVIDDMYKFIFDENDGAYNGRVTTHIIGTTTYSIAWGFNKPTAFTVKTTDGTKYQQLTLSGETTITAEDATKGIKGLYFGDDFIASITGETFLKTELDGASSIEMTFNSRLKDQQLGGKVKPFIVFTENEVVILYPLRKDDDLALHFLDVQMGLIEPENYELEFKLIDGVNTIRTYTWDKGVVGGNKQPFQLGGFPTLTISFKKG